MAEEEQQRLCSAGGWGDPGLSLSPWPQPSSVFRPRASPSAAPAPHTVTLFSELGICQVRNSPDNGATLAARVRFLPSDFLAISQAISLLSGVLSSCVRESLMSQVPPSALPPCLWVHIELVRSCHVKPPIPDSSIGTSAPGKKGGTEA